MVKSYRILLRPLRVFDLPDVYVNIRDERVTQWTRPPTPILADKRLALYFYKVFRHIFKGITLIFKSCVPIQKSSTAQLAILLKETNRVIGIVTIKKHKDSGSKAEISFWMGVAYWGKGIMTETLPLAIEYAFLRMGCEIITAWTYEANMPSRKVMEKCGFKFIGTDKNAYYKFGQWHNRLNYSMLRQEWFKLIGKQSTAEVN